MKIIRGNVYTVDFNPRVHTKPGKIRPAVVVQSNLVSDAGYSSTIVVPATSKIIDDAGMMRLRIPRGVCGFDKPSDLLLGQVLAVANLSFRKHLGVLPDEIWQELLKRLKIILELG